jgi:hypothetical protein
MGPEGGDGGGEVVAQGTPEQIVRNPRSYTACIRNKFRKFRQVTGGDTLLQVAVTMTLYSTPC